MSAERINVLQFRIGFLKQSKLNVAVRRLELRRVLELQWNNSVGTACPALCAVFRWRVGYRRIPDLSRALSCRMTTAHSGRSSSACSFLYIGQWPWLPPQEMLVTQRIVMMRRQPSDQPRERTLTAPLSCFDSMRKFPMFAAHLLASGR